MTAPGSAPGAVAWGSTWMPTSAVTSRSAYVTVVLHTPAVSVGPRRRTARIGLAPPLPEEWDWSLISARCTWERRSTRRFV